MKLLLRLNLNYNEVYREIFRLSDVFPQLCHEE